MNLNILLDRPASPRRSGDDLRPWLGWIRLILIAGLCAGLWGAILAFLGWAALHH